MRSNFLDSIVIFYSTNLPLLSNWNQIYIHKSYVKGLSLFFPQFFMCMLDIPVYMLLWDTLLLLCIIFWGALLIKSDSNLGVCPVTGVYWWWWNWERYFNILTSVLQFQLTYLFNNLHQSYKQNRMKPIPNNHI